MSNTVFVSFVYPNCEKHLPKMMRSLNEQSDTDFDIIIFNDGMKNIGGICETQLDQSVQIYPVVGSIPKIREIGLARLKTTDYTNVIFGDADDSFASNRIEVAKTLLLEHDLVVNDVHLCHEPPKKSVSNYFQKRIQVNSHFNYRAIKNSNFIGFSNSSIRMSKIPHIEFNDDIIAVDWALFTTILLEGARAYFTGNTYTTYFIHENSHYDVTSKNLVSMLYKAQVKSKHYQYLSSKGLGFKEECKNIDLIIKRLTDEISSGYEQPNLIDDCDCPLWWELPSKVYLEKNC